MQDDNGRGPGLNVEGGIGKLRAIDICKSLGLQTRKPLVPWVLRVAWILVEQWLQIHTDHT